MQDQEILYDGPSWNRGKGEHLERWVKVGRERVLALYWVRGGKRRKAFEGNLPSVPRIPSVTPERT